MLTVSFGHFPHSHYSFLSLRGSKMPIGVIEATVIAVYPSAGAVAADNNLRIASLTMGAYECVVDRLLVADLSWGLTSV
jgi:hypothetical protein